MNSRSARLWSLWDMFEIYGPDLHAAIAEMEELKGTINAITQKGQDGLVNLDANNRSHVIGILDRVMPPLERCNALLAHKAAQELRESLGNPYSTVPFVGAWSAFTEINRRFKHELELVKMYIVYRDKLHLLEPPEKLIGEKVMERFSDISTDVSEAASCLCYGRATASAFHSLRVAEVGLEAFRKHIGIPDPVIVNDRNWGNIINGLRDEIDKRWPQKKALPKSDGATIRAIFDAAKTIKTSARDPTMHVERTYSDAQADLVRLNVRDFMEQLAERCDQDGQPKA